MNEKCNIKTVPDPIVKDDARHCFTFFVDCEEWDYYV
jgi:hypothetical protein